MKIYSKVVLVLKYPLAHSRASTDLNEYPIIFCFPLVEQKLK